MLIYLSVCSCLSRSVIADRVALMMTSFGDLGRPQLDEELPTEVNKQAIQ